MFHTFTLGTKTVKLPLISMENCSLVLFHVGNRNM